MQLPIPWEIDREALGLEIGPLDKPRLDRSVFNVLYVDHLPTDALQAKYRDDPNVSVVQPVDVVWPGHGPLVSALPSAHRSNMCLRAMSQSTFRISSAGWARSSTAMAPGGFVALILPDKRYCFDVRRSETRVRHLVDAHLRDTKAPTFQQIYEFNASIVPVDTQAIWRGDPGFSDTTAPMSVTSTISFRMCEEQQRSGEYVDVHCWAFTPAGFADCYERLSKLGLVDLRGADRADSRRLTRVLRHLEEATRKRRSGLVAAHGQASAADMVEQTRDRPRGGSTCGCSATTSRT